MASEADKKKAQALIDEAEAGFLTLNGVDYPRMQLLTIADVLDGIRFETPSRVLGRHEPQPVLPHIFSQAKKGK